jgi:hypothetical protein
MRNIVIVVGLACLSARRALLWSDLRSAIRFSW